MTTTPTGPPRGLLAVGAVYLDLVFARLPQAPRPGREIRTTETAHGPGGIANQAIAAARLGSPVQVAAAIGTGPMSTLCLDALDREGVDTSALVVLADWDVPITASLGYDGDRALVTGGEECSLRPDDLVPEGCRFPSAAIVHLGDEPSRWTAAAAAAGTRIYADRGWDETGRWDAAVLGALADCFAFTPNATEAMAWTRTDTPVAAARRLAERVPLCVVTAGADGVVAVDSATGREHRIPAVRVDAVDPTGAGDVFAAALAVAGDADLELEDQLDLAALVAAVSVGRPGGASAAPRTAELGPWLDAHPEAVGQGRAARLHSIVGSLHRNLPDPHSVAGPTEAPRARQVVAHSKGDTP